MSKEFQGTVQVKYKRVWVLAFFDQYLALLDTAYILLKMVSVILLL